MMKTKLKAFQNQGGYLEYGILMKKHWWSRWHFLKNVNGYRALYRFVDAEKTRKELMGDEA